MTKMRFFILKSIFSILFILADPFFLFSNEYQRIVSLGPVLTEELYLLGADSRLIADTTYCIHPEAAKNKTKAGTIVDIDVEKTAYLKPDLILATGLSDPNQLEKLKKLGIHVEVFLQPKDYDEICTQFLRLAKLCSREKAAVKMVRKAKTEVEKIRIAASKLPAKKVFVQIGSEPLFTVSKDSFIHDFIKLGNGVNIAADSGIGYFSREKVLQADPDNIIISDMGISGSAETQKWNKFQTLAAVKNHAVFTIDSYSLCSPTPLSFPGTLREITFMIHPELKKEALK